MLDEKTLMMHATEARSKAYAPYSRFQVGSAIETADGSIVQGCNVENAAYSVTTCAETNAIGSMIAQGQKHIKQIAVLVEGPHLSAPCGACRQRIYEFSSPDTVIHLFNLAGDHQTYRMNELLPHAFGPNDLIEK